MSNKPKLSVFINGVLRVNFKTACTIKQAATEADNDTSDKVISFV